jgi:hydrogenase maturation protease
MIELAKDEILILGMGNKFFGDDGVGIIIAEKLRNLLTDFKQIKVEDTNWGGFRIIDILSGYKSAIIIDALKTGQKPTGFIHKLNYKDLIHSVRMVSFHDINFSTAVEFAKMLKIPMPENITVFAIEINDSDFFSEELSEEAAAAVDNCIQIILAELSTKYKIEINQFTEI